MIRGHARELPHNFRRLVLTALSAAMLLAAPSVAQGQQNNLCDQSGESPDLTAGEITGVTRWGSVTGITAFSFGLAACNIGTCWLEWNASTADHPVTGQNLFRLENGRFEQIGQSWLFHEYFALSEARCSTGCLATSGTHLGVLCSTTNSASIQGSHVRLGPKSQVNASSGVFPFPAEGMGQTGDAIFKRLQVHDSELDPSVHFDASYFVEVQLVARDDAAAGNLHNNASHRPIVVTGTAGSLNIALTGATVRAQPAIEAWKVSNADVTLANVSVPGDGRFVVGARVTPTASGYHYEYAVLNLDSHRSAGSFSVPIPPGATVSDVGFHDVDYHSGEPFSGADWTATIAGDAIVWTTETFAANENANALRWGTLYNFRFDSPLHPSSGQATLGLFRPGVPDEVLADVPVPCGGIDADADSRTSACDCDDADPLAWRTPGEARDLILFQDPGNGTMLGWSAPIDPGGTATVYDVIRSPDPSDFVTAAACVPSSDASSLTRVDSETPGPGALFSYLIRARNSCPAGSGTAGSGSDGAPRVVRACDGDGFVFPTRSREK